MKADIPPRKLPHETVGLGGAATVPLGTMRLCGCGCRRWYYTRNYYQGFGSGIVWWRVGWWQFIRRHRIRKATA